MATATTATVSQTADDEIEMVECDECGCEMTQDEYDEEEGLCVRCTAKVMRVCKRCNETYHVEDAHTEFAMCCDSCGDDERQEIADGLWSEIEDLVGSWSAETYEVSNMRRLLAYAKKLHDQSAGA